MPLPNLFADQATSTGQQLDDNFSIVGFLGSIPCICAGTNALTLTPFTYTPSLTAFLDYMSFTAVAAATNDTTTSAAIGGLSPLTVYKDTRNGASVLTGGEIVAGCAFTLIYDATLSSGAGGFHLEAVTAVNGSTIALLGLLMGSPAVVQTILGGTCTVTFTVMPAQTTQDQNVSLAASALGDMVWVNPPTSVISGVMYQAHVVAAGTVAIRAANITAASLTPTGGTFGLTGFRLAYP